MHTFVAKNWFWLTDFHEMACRIFVAVSVVRKCRMDGMPQFIELDSSRFQSNLSRHSLAGVNERGNEVIESLAEVSFT